jgi:hypothetical protein
MSNEFTVAQRHFAERGTASFRPARRRAFWPEKPTLQTTIIRERRRASRLPSVPSALRGRDPRHALPMFWATIGASPESASASMRTRDQTLQRHRARPRSQRDQAMGPDWRQRSADPGQSGQVVPARTTQGCAAPLCRCRLPRADRRHVRPRLIELAGNVGCTGLSYPTKNASVSWTTSCTNDATSAMYQGSGSDAPI